MQLMRIVVMFMQIACCLLTPTARASCMCSRERHCQRSRRPMDQHAHPLQCRLLRHPKHLLLHQVHGNRLLCLRGSRASRHLWHPRGCPLPRRRAVPPWYPPLLPQPPQLLRIPPLMSCLLRYAAANALRACGTGRLRSPQPAQRMDTLPTSVPPQPMGIMPTANGYR